MARDGQGVGLKVAAVQFRSSLDLDDNLTRIEEHLRRLSQEGVRVVALPECSVTSYDGSAIERLSETRLLEAEAELSRMCREHGLYLVAGIPYFEDGERYNGALVWDPRGTCIARYAKIRLAGEPWCLPGKRFVLFRVDQVVCSVIVCHDSRYPELVRLPVIAGAQVIFYISCESDITHESKLGPYRAQIQARAEENTVYLVQSNTPAVFGVQADGEVGALPSGSHGESRIIAPDGNIVCEATYFKEEVLVADLDLSRASRGFALNSLGSEFLKGWWEEGLKLVPPVEG